MRRILFAGTMMGLLACAGCFTNWSSDIDTKTPPGGTDPISKAPPLVRPEQITPENGHQVCEALNEELTYEAQQRMLKTR
jgi:hypothetical protein